MKKNLRIVSAAAAALLAVAPVAATVAPAASTIVSADANTETKTFLKKGADVTLTNTLNTAKDAEGMVSEGTYDWHARYDWAGTAIAKGTKVKVVNATRTENVVVSYTGSDKKTHYAVLNQSALLQMVTTDDKSDDTSSEKINAGNFESSIFDPDANTSVTINAVAANHFTTGAINGNIIYTDAQGQSHTALLHGKNNVTVYQYNNDNTLTKATKLVPGQLYAANFSDVTVNLGNAAAGTTVKFVLPKTASFQNPDKDQPYANVKTVPVNSNGVADLGSIWAQFYAYNADDLQEVHFYSEKTGNVVTSGNITLHAVNGQLNISSLFHAMNMEYKASQLDHGKSSTYAKNYMLPVAVQNDLRDQLKKQNIEVDPNGYFKAPASFTLNMNAKSIYNGATATLPVTVTVDNVTPTAAQETTKTVKIMHIATIYDKNGKATHEPALRAYNTVSVVSDPVSLKDEKGNDAGKFYKLAGKDQYIKVGNVDGTKRTLKHNSYVYKSTGKRRGKTVLKKGSSVTTYGKSFMIAGHQMYRIGENKYVKKANF